MTPVISVVGRHNSGKTTLLVRLLEELTARGLRVAVLKHSRSQFRLTDDNDAHRLFNAGAETVLAVSPEVTLRYQRQPEQEPERYLAELATGAFDLIITEGYKHERFLKIEVLRQAIDRGSMNLPGTIAQVSDFPLTSGLPAFTFDDIKALSDFIIKSVS